MRREMRLFLISLLLLLISSYLVSISIIPGILTITIIFPSCIYISYFLTKYLLIISVRLILFAASMCVSLFLSALLSILLINPLDQLIKISTIELIVGDNYQIFSERMIAVIIIWGIIIALLILKKYGFNIKSPYVIYGLFSIVIMETIMTLTIQLMENYLFENSNEPFSNTVTNALYAVICMYFFNVNMFTFFAYLYDKIIAMITGNKFFISIPRIPENILHFYAKIGGTFGAAIAMWLINHKRTSTKFQPVYKKILAMQALLIIILFLFNGVLEA